MQMKERPKMKGSRTRAELHGSSVPAEVSAVPTMMDPAITRILPLINSLVSDVVRSQCDSHPIQIPEALKYRICGCLTFML